MLSVWRLQILVQFYNLKTMRAVSESLMVSPATVSSQLKLLEDETNSVLFEKQGRNVKLTSAGLKLVQQVQPVLDQLEIINNNFANTNKLIQGNVRIAGFHSSLQTIIIPVVEKLKNDYPQIKITVAEMKPEQSISALNAHQFDLVLVAKFGDKDFSNNMANNMIELGSDQLKILVSANNKLANLKSANALQLRDQSWVLENSNNYITKYINNLYFKYNLEPKVWGVLQSYSALQNAVSDDLAISVLPGLALINPIDNIKLIDLKPANHRHIYLVKRKPQSSIPAIQIVSEMLEKQAKEVFHKINS